LPGISVVIPALNEEKALPATLRSLLTQEGWREAWVVDGGSTDATLEIIREFESRDPRVHGLGAPRGRGSQMNAGARMASGDILLFLHADTVLGSGCFDRLRGGLTDTRLRAGCFSHRFSEPTLSLRLLSVLHNWRFDWTRIAYGDQTLFVARELFREIGGFPETPLEDIRFGEMLRRVTHPRRLRSAVVTDSRKFRELGAWRAVGCVLNILALYKLGRIPRSRFFKDVR
jgi:rSAM/selenodomain-associated transferase 2